ncbi:MAG: succinylglutamate desuccinylase/aspartoacylase family protein [Nitrospinae bacterium]|nr:succinylglutamate desuccinylase/aspartoacylase family protein [Nitrospinota bacterium]
MSETSLDSWEIGGVEIAAGSYEYVKIPVAQMLTGSETGLPLHCVRGEKPGLTLSVLACVHGDEPQPIRAFQNVLAQIDRKQLSGALLLVPVANPFAFANFSRQSPDQHEQTNLWGAFPGSARGTLTQRYAHKIRETLIERADYLVEFHSGGASGRIQRRVDMDPDAEGAVGEKSREMAIAFASGGAALVHGVPFSTSSASGYALTQKIPAISVEIGGAYLPECEENLYRENLEGGFLNLLVHLGMLPGEEKRLRITYFGFANRAEANPSNGGYLVSRKTHFADLGAKVSEGELLGEMLDPFSLEVVEELRSPADGVLFFSRCSGPFEVGNKGFAVATEYREI